jgi:hypothetical protein
MATEEEQVKIMEASQAIASSIRMLQEDGYNNLMIMSALSAALARMLMATPESNRSRLANVFIQSLLLCK